MNKVLYVKAYSVGLCLGVFFVMSSVVFVSPLHGGKKHIKRVDGKHISSNLLIPFINARTMQFASMEPKPDPTLKKILYDTTIVKIHRSSREKRMENLLHPIILRAANGHKIDSALVKAIIMVESGYNPRAISEKGARGLMQLMPRTAKLLGVRDSFNPEQNINAGVKHLKSLLEQFKGNVKLALAAYHAGSIKVRKYQGVPPYKSTRSYIKKVFQYYQYYSYKII